MPERFAQRARFALRVRGDSMTEDQIEHDDLVLIQPQAVAEDGAIDGEQATVKRLYRESQHLRLPANAAIAPLRFPPDAVEILGVVTAVVREQPHR